MLVTNLDTDLCTFQRKPEESPVKEGMVKKVKQDEGQTNEVEETHTNEVLSSNGHSGMEVEVKFGRHPI